MCLASRTQTLQGKPLRQPRDREYYQASLCATHHRRNARCILFSESRTPRQEKTPMGPKANSGSGPWLNAALAVALCLSLAPRALWGQEYKASDAPPEVRSALANFPIWQSHTETDRQFHQRQLSTLHSLLKQYPQDFFVRKKYVDLSGSTDEEKTSLISEYKALHEQ